ncbi:MAG: HAD-IB family hydrolase [Zoogloeaceae bacterium]|jgi:HAD superfamily hydrolase (TIGR01490 family)|nr:HAD-IB family hydrolase [Zoogloeaceae bacterium]
MQLALFDLDNTLLSGDSDFEWMQFLICQGVLDKASQTARNEAFYAEYKAGVLDIGAFLDFQFAPLTRHPRATLERWRQIFLVKFIRPLIGNKARALVSGHLAKGDLCAIVTATNSFVTSPIAREFGIHHLIATVPACDKDGKFTGVVRGTPTFKAGKVERVETWLEAQGLWWSDFSGSLFYSDSHNDLPLLEKVSRPIAVDPDDILRARAGQKGWETISLR